MDRPMFQLGDIVHNVISGTIYRLTCHRPDSVFREKDNWLGYGLRGEFKGYTMCSAPRNLVKLTPEEVLALRLEGVDLEAGKDA